MKIWFCHNLYIPQTMQYPRALIWRLRHRAGHLSLYALMLRSGDEAKTSASLCGEDQAEICHTAFLMQPYYRKNPPYIFGLAGSREEAVRLLCCLMEKSMQEIGRPDLRACLFPEGEIGEYFGGEIQLVRMPLKESKGDPS